jgi:PAS domain S-box-containing protein
MGLPVVRRESRLDSLGLKLNLALLVVFLVVGGATAAFVFFGFNRTQENATARSQEALEQQGANLLQYQAFVQADTAAIELEWAAELGHRTARYLEDFKRSGATAPPTSEQLAQTPDGAWYDPNPDRISDVIVPNYADVNGAVLGDIEYSAALDALLPALFGGFPGELTQDAFHPTALSFLTPNGMARYYPAIGLQDVVPADLRFENLLISVGPEGNPARETVWSTPYQDAAGKGLVITANAPVYEGGVFRGAIQVDLSIGRLVEQINDVKPTDHGFAFYVDTDGEILRTEAFDLLANELKSQDNQALAGIIERMRVGEPGIERVFLGGREYFISWAEIGGVSGSFAVVAPLEELTAEAAAVTAEIDDQGNQTMLYVLVSLTVLFGVALIAASYLNRRVLVRPIEALAEGTRAVAQGDFDTRIAVQGNDELAALGRSFNQMTADIQREVHQREAAQEELRALFAAMTDAVVVLNKEGLFLRVPQTNSPPLLMPPENLPGNYMRDVMPQGQADEFLKIVEQALEEQRTATVEYPLEIDDKTYWFSAAVSPVSENEVVVVARDITDRINARQELERQVASRTQELTTLLTVSRNIASNLALHPLVQTIIGQVKDIVDYSRCSLFILDGDGLIMLDSRTADSSQSPIMRVTLTSIAGIWDRIGSGTTAIEGNVRTSDSPVALAYRTGSGDLFETAYRDIHSWMGVPLETNDRVIGMLTVSHNEPDFYTEHHADLLAAVATQVAIAIENSRLYEQVSDRTQELSSLLSVSRNVASTLELGPLLELIVEQLKSIADFHRCSIFELEGDTMVILDSRAIQAESVPSGLRVPTGVLGSIWDGMQRGESIIIDDVHDSSDFAQGYRAAAGDLWETQPFQMIHACLGVPLIAKDRIIGMLVLSHMEPAFYTERQAELVAAVATQIAVAIENARLYEQAQQLAAVEERQRLARELHDSVSQALYGIALGARTARTLLDRDPEKVAEPVDYVLSLAEAGLAEMRALIFELRPESLEIEGLVAALDKQVAATAARYGIDVTAELSDEPEMDLAQKEIFYRIGQEALHNMIKHAHASKAVVRFGAENGSYVLEVGDNGVGFDTSQSFPGHMGLVSMTERASSIGAELEVESKPGEGTVIKLRSASRS